MGGGEALAKLRKLDPAGSYDLNHSYIGAGQAVPVGNEDTQKPAGGRPLVGLIDRGAGRHPALDGLIVEQRGFAPGGVVPGGHGTAVASLLVGRDGRPAERSVGKEGWVRVVPGGRRSLKKKTRKQ